MQKINLSFKRFGLDIKLRVEKHNESNYIIPVPLPFPNGTSIRKLVLVDIKEFIDDINYLIPKSLEGNIEEIAFESLYQIMVKHIRTYGRIYRNDLDTYLAENILLFNAILKAKGKSSLNEKEQQERFIKFNKIAFGILPENLKSEYLTS